MGKSKTSGAQDLSIALPGCVTQNIVIHELLHAVGFAHEQTRPDRDQFVTINWGNVQSGTENNFRLYSTSDVSTLNKPYDMRKNERRSLRQEKERLFLALFSVDHALQMECLLEKWSADSDA